MTSPTWRAFFDANLSPRLGKMIQALEESLRRVVHIRDHPILKANNTPEGNSTPDIEWIELLGSEGDWLVISGDTAIIDPPNEREVLKNSGLPFFAFDKYFANAGRYEQALQLLQMWPEIVRKVDAGETGIFLVRMKQKKSRRSPSATTRKVAGCEVK